MATEIIIPEVLPEEEVRKQRVELAEQAAEARRADYDAHLKSLEPKPPSGTLVPNGGFVETDYEPHAGVTKEELARLSPNDLWTAIRKQRRKTREEMTTYLLYFDEAVRRWKVTQERTDAGQFAPKYQPTLPEAFKAIGRNYEAERKKARRYLNELNGRPRTRKSPSFEEGDFVQNGDGDEFVFIGEPKPGEAEIVPLGGNLADAQIVPMASVTRRVPVKVKWNDLILCIDDNKLYRYAGASGIQEEDDSSALLKQVRERDEAEVEAQQKHKREAERAKADEKSQREDKLRAEVADRDRSLVTAKPNKWPKACSACGHKEEGMKGAFCESCKKKRDEQKDVAEVR